MCITLHAWIVADEFPPWAEVKGMLPELRSLWHHRNNLSVDTNGTIWRKRSSQSGPQGWPGTTISVLSRVIVWRSPGTDTNTSEIGGPFLLVGNV